MITLIYLALIECIQVNSLFKTEKMLWTIIANLAGFLLTFSSLQTTVNAYLIFRQGNIIIKVLKYQLIRSILPDNNNVDQALRA